MKIIRFVWPIALFVFSIIQAVVDGWMMLPEGVHYARALGRRAATPEMGGFVLLVIFLASMAALLLAGAWAIGFYLMFWAGVLATIAMGAVVSACFRDLAFDAWSQQIRR